MLPNAVNLEGSIIELELFLEKCITSFSKAVYWLLDKIKTIGQYKLNVMEENRLTFFNASMFAS